ncbi:MAG: RES family NAD+ phosphorylase [Pelobium sp.]
MKLYRLGNCMFSGNLSGEGARIYGGRWNSIGVPAVYFANSRALAVLEVLVHLSPVFLPDNFCMVEFEVDGNYFEIQEENLPKDWNVFPFLKNVQKIGDQFLKDNGSPLIKVPSAIVKGEYNFVLNPLHHESGNIKLMDSRPFSFDERLF